MYKSKLTLEEADNEQSNFENELKGIDKGIRCKFIIKNSFLNNVWFILGAWEKVFNYFKGRIFPIKDKIPTLKREPATEPAPEPAAVPAPNPKVFHTPETKTKRSQLKLRKNF